MAPYKILTLAAIAMLPSVLLAQDEPVEITAAKAFVSEPGAVFGILEPNTRLDMLDYYHAGMSRPSKNSLDGQCYIVAEDTCSLTLVAGQGIEYQVFVLNRTSGNPIYGVIQTLSTPVADSSVRFYDRSWEPITQPLLTAPTLQQWMRKGANKRRAEVEEAVPFILASYTYDPQSQTVTITNNLAQYYLPSDTPVALSLLRDRLTYVWNGKKFNIKDK